MKIANTTILLQFKIFILQRKTLYRVHESTVSLSIKTKQHVAIIACLIPFNLLPATFDLGVVGLSTVVGLFTKETV